MPDRNTVGSVDEAARKKFKEQMQSAGRPMVRRTVATPTKTPAVSPWMSVMQVIRTSFDDIAAQLVGRRAADMSGRGGRQRQATVDEQANAAQGLDANGQPLK